MIHKQITGWTVNAVCLVCCALGGAESGIFNSGFELGTAGFTCNKFLRPDLNPQMIFERPVSDETVKVNGKRSLRIPNRFAERVHLSGREILLEKGKPYTCSIWMKSTAPQKVSISIIGTHPEQRWDSSHASFSIGTEWQQYSFNFTPRKAVKFYSPRLVFGEKTDAPAADLYLDDWVIRPANAKNAVPVLEIAAISEKRYFIRNEGEELKIPVTISVYNPGNVSRPVKIKLTATEDFSGNWPEPVSLGRSETIKLPEMTLGPGESRNVNVSLPISRYGAYLLTPQADQASVYGKPFAVIGKVTPVTGSIRPPFCAAVNGRDLFSTPPNYKYKTLSFFGMDCSPDEYMRFLADHGVRLMRCFGYPDGGFSWRNIEPEPGKFNFDETDRLLALTSKYQIQLLPVLGEYDFCAMDNFREKRALPVGLPDWLIPLCRKQLLPGKTPLEKNAQLTPPMELWARFVRQISARYKGKIGQYEIINEPHLMFRNPADYVPFLKTAYEAIKQEDPQATVVGFCATSDLGARMEAFYKPCFLAGGLNYADAVSFHPYQNPKLGSTQRADQMVKIIRGMIKNFSPKSFPLWNTELYYLRGKVSNHYVNSYAGSADLAQRTLFDLGEGIAQSISLEHTQLQRMSGPHFISSDGVSADLTPNSHAVTLNALARLFEGASPVAKLRWESNVICYIVRRADGSLAAAFWHYGNRKGVSVLLPEKDKRAKLLDIMGNPIDWEKQLVLPADNAPCYILWDGKNKNDFTLYLNACSVEVEKPVLVSQMIRLIPAADGTWNAAVQLTNTSGKAVSGKIGLVGDGICAKTASAFQLNPKEQRSVEIPVFVKNAANVAEIRLLYNGLRYNFPVTVSPGTRMGSPDGVWTDFPVLKGKNYPASARWCLTKQNDDLVFRIEVEDHTPSGPSGTRKPWEQDCVEVFLDNAPCMIPEMHPTAYHKGCFRLFLLPYAEAGKQLQFMHTKGTMLNDESVSLKTEITKNGYVLILRIRIAALALAAPGRLGLELTVNNAEFKNPGTSSCSWSGAPKAFCNRMGFGIVIW